MIVTPLESTARALVPSGRGILAADESHPSIEKRVSALGIENTVENRRVYRQMLFTTPGVAAFISGVILFDETIRQKADDGMPLGDLLALRGMIPGIKVDKGARALAGSAGELITEGLDGLRERLAEYRGLGARFAKWRAVITIGSGIPTPYCIDTNAHALARYAALCQEAGLVPIVEPEVLMDGNHTIERCVEVTEATLHTVFAALHRQRVSLEGMLLKPNMALSGKSCPRQAGVQEVAEATVRSLAAGPRPGPRGGSPGRGSPQEARPADAGGGGARHLRERAPGRAGAGAAPQDPGGGEPGGAGYRDGIVAKDLGYELRCAPPRGFDIQYCRSLGYWATRFLLDGGTEALATIQGGRLVPIPFGDLLDPTTGKIRVRYADIHSEAYRTLHAYMIRLKREDFERPDQREALARAAKLSEPEFVHRFGYVAGYG